MYPITLPNDKGEEVTLDEHGRRYDTTGPVVCEICGAACEREQGSVAIGYAIIEDVDGVRSKICYECAADFDRAMMVQTGYHSGLYLVKVQTEPRGNIPPVGMSEEDWRRGFYRWEVTNWPGTLRFNVPHVKKSDGYTPTGGYYVRYDFWFIGPDEDGGRAWWYGRNQTGDLARCRRIKDRLGLD